MVKKNNKNAILYTFPLITTGNIKEIEFSLIQFEILKHINIKCKIKPMANELNCSPANIRHHLRKLEKDNLVTYSGTNSKTGVWRITKSGLQVLKGGNRRRVVSKNKVVKKGCITSKRQRKINLTKLQSKVYNLIVEKERSQESIALELGTSQQNISIHYKKAKDKLHIIGGNKKEVVKRMSLQPITPQIPTDFRAHNYRWSIQILEKLKGFKIGTDTFGNCKISIWEKKIVITSKDDFFGNTPEDSFFCGLDYFGSIWSELEKIYKIKIDIVGTLNKNLYQCDIANINNEMATVLIGEGNKFYVRDKNGVAWATFDNSFNIFEFETIRAKSVLPDQIAVQRHLNDWRENLKSYTNSELTDFIKQLLLLQSNSTQAQTRNDEHQKKNNLIITEILREIDKIKQDIRMGAF